MTNAQERKKIEFEEYDLDNGLHVILHEDHSTPIVAVTASATQEDRERCLATGMSDFITKPIRMKQLDKVLAEYLESEPKLKAS